jgi:hypothetical protein
VSIRNDSILLAGEALRKTEIAAVCLFVGVAAIACGGEPDSTIAKRPTLEQIATDHALIKGRYVRFACLSGG